jgi:hypothetical protein
MFHFISALDEAYDRKSWHGTNLRGALRGLTAERAVARPAPGRNNIWELALHCAYWKYVVWRKLSGAKRGSFPLKGSNFWVREGGDQRLWAAELRLLGEMHSALRGVVERLDRMDSKQEFLVRGAAAHDLYHAGQIQLIKRLV